MPLRPILTELGESRVISSPGAHSLYSYGTLYNSKYLTTACKLYFISWLRPSQRNEFTLMSSKGHSHEL